MTMHKCMATAGGMLSAQITVTTGDGLVTAAVMAGNPRQSRSLMAAAASVTAITAPCALSYARAHSHIQSNKKW